MDQYTLSYVNLPETEVHLDMQFDTIIKLIAFVNDNFPKRTSYQIIVTTKPA